MLAGSIDAKSFSVAALLQEREDSRRDWQAKFEQEYSGFSHQLAEKVFEEQKALLVQSMKNLYNPVPDELRPIFRQIPLSITNAKNAKEIQELIGDLQGFPLFQEWLTCFSEQKPEGSFRLVTRWEREVRDSEYFDACMGKVSRRVRTVLEGKFSELASLPENRRLKYVVTPHRINDPSDFVRANDIDISVWLSGEWVGSESQKKQILF